MDEQSDQVRRRCRTEWGLGGMGLRLSEVGSKGAWFRKWSGYPSAEARIDVLGRSSGLLYNDRTSVEQSGNPLGRECRVRRSCSLPAAFHDRTSGK